MRLISRAAASLCVLGGLASLAACGGSASPSAAGSTRPPTTSSTSPGSSGSADAAPSRSADGSAGSGPCAAISARQIERWAGVKVAHLAEMTHRGEPIGCRATFDYEGSLTVGWTVVAGSVQEVLEGALKHIVIAGKPAGEATVASSGAVTVDIGIDARSHLEVMAMDLGVGAPPKSTRQLRRLAERVAAAY